MILTLISAFVVRCLDNIIPLVSIPEISSLYLASVAAKASLRLPWSQTPKTGFLMTRLICTSYKKSIYNKAVPEPPQSTANHFFSGKDKVGI